jgi:signal transduction histidine kinase/PAS domain-containing protein
LNTIMTSEAFPAFCILIIKDGEENGDRLLSPLHRSGLHSLFVEKTNLVQILELIKKGHRILLFSSSFENSEIVQFLNQLKEQRNDDDIVVIIQSNEDNLHLPEMVKNDFIVEKVNEHDTDALVRCIKKWLAIFGLEKQLSHKEGAFRKILDRFPIPVSVIDPTYRILYVNKAQREMTPEAYRGQRCYVSMAGGLSAGDVPCAPCALTNTFESGHDEIIERWGAKKDGSPWYSRQKSTPIIEHGQVIASIKTVEDRSDILKRFELEKKPDVQFKKRLQEMLHYMAQSGFTQGACYDIQWAPEGGIRASELLTPPEKKELISASYAIDFHSPIVTRFKYYESLLKKQGRNELIYSLVSPSDIRPLTSESFIADKGTILEVPLFVYNRTFALLTFDKKRESSLPEIAMAEVQQHIPFLLNGVLNLERILVDIERIKTTDEERYLLSLAEDLASLRDEEELYRVFLLKIAAYLGPPAEGVMMSFDSEQQRLCKKAWIGSHAHLWCDLSVHGCQLPFCTAVSDNKKIIIQDFPKHALYARIDDHCLFQHLSDKKKIKDILKWLKKVNSWVSFPVKAGDRVSGIIGFLSDEKFYFTQSKIYFIERALKIVQLVIARIQTEEVKKQAAAAGAQLQVALRTVHNLRTPSTAARNYLEVLTQWLDCKRSFHQDMKEDRAQARQVVERAFKQLLRIERLASDIQDLLKPLKLRSRPIQLAALIRETIENIVAPLVPPILTFYEFDDPLVSVNVDVDSIKEVFEQIVENAERAMKESSERAIKVKGMKIKGGVSSNNLLSDNEDYIVITISDTGRGMPEEIKEWIFDPWVSASPSSTGLGLAITKKIIEEHNGRIWLENSGPEGTTFALALPVYNDK